MILFFFFQAEDGIRDLTVTGVQTCALPILTVYVPPKAADRIAGRLQTIAAQHQWALSIRTDSAALADADLAIADSAGTLVRSEEHTSELQSQSNLVCRLLLEKKKKRY